MPECSCRMDTLNAIIRAEESTNEAIGSIIMLLLETQPERELPSRRELIRLIRRLTGFHREFCPACRKWLDPQRMTEWEISDDDVPF